MISYSENALAIYERLYFDEKQGERIPEDVHNRVSKFIGNDEIERREFLNILNKKLFRPNSPCLINAGRISDKAHDKQLCACFVLGLEDSMESIIQMWSICAKIYASGAGAGIPITNLREYSSPISSGGVASGPLKYLRVVDILSDTVRSGGRSRRAANIGTFKYNHPETIDIINCKTTDDAGSHERRRLTSFNLSMAVPDYFMELLEENPNEEVDIISPNNNEVVNKLRVKDIWDNVLQAAWKSGDPGLLFIDYVNRFNPMPSLGEIESTNPCGEVPLLPWSVCNIGSINVSEFIVTGRIDKVALKAAIRTAVRFLDNVIEKTAYLDPKFESMCKRTRPIGLGLMGFADMLIQIGIPYGSDRSIKLFKDLCFFINREAIATSIDLAAEKGAIPIDEKDKNHFYKLLAHYTGDNKSILNAYMKHGIRNSTWTCIAPTGSISMSADCSYAWEPLMALVWEKPLVDSDKVLTIIHPEFEKQLNKWIMENTHDGHLQANTEAKKEKILQDIINNHGSIQSLNYLPQSMREIFKVAHDIDPITKITMQGEGQEFVSLAISSTCNLPNCATIEDIDNIYRHAWKSGLKGVTIFRDGCLDKQVVNFGKIKDVEKRRRTDHPLTRPIKRAGETVEINTPHGKLFVTCNVNQEMKPFEIFFRVGKQGALTNVLIDALGRVCSKSLQAGIPMEVITDTLRGLSGEKFWFRMADEIEKTSSAESIVDAIAQLIEHHWSIPSIPMETISTQCEHIEMEKCPQCHRKTLRRDTGCRGGSCMACGFSNCG